MKKLLNTLYITSEDAFLSLDGENVVVSFADDTRKAFPLHMLSGIVSFSYKGATPALLGKCVADGVMAAFFSPQGRFLFQVGSETAGNVYLRREQYRIADDEVRSIGIARNFVAGKLYNAKYVLLRCARDHAMQVDAEALRRAAANIQAGLSACIQAENDDALRGIEGNAASQYFGTFDEMILRDKEYFAFQGRTRRPPLDRVNALLSFAYALLTADCAAALRGVGLDPYVGFMHVDRPGRKSLALDLMEELRTVYADRFVLTLINNRIIPPDSFTIQQSGAVLLSDDARKTFLGEWQKRKRDEFTHPYLGEKLSWGMAPHIQALLLARHVRGDLDQYPPLFWK